MSSCTIKVERDGDLQEVNPKDLTNSELCHLLSELLIDSEFATSDECHDWALAREEAVRRLKQNGETQDDVGQFYDAKPVVNAAKLREALCEMLNAAFVVILRHGNATEEMGRLALCADNARSALAEPVKNCEVGTAEVQLARFIAFCKGQRLHTSGHADTCNPKCPCRDGGDINLCALTWAQMPYDRKSESTAKPRVLVIDDARFMLSYAQKFLDFCDVEQEYSIPKDETMLAKYDVIIVDGEGIGNPKYKDGIEFCKAYEKQGDNKGLIYHSGLMPDRADREILKERGIKMLLKGDVPGKFVAAVKEIV